MTEKEIQVSDEEEIKALKIQCEYCKTHCGEAFHFNLAKLNFILEKEISELKKENKELRCCGNCKYREMEHEFNICHNCENCSNWKFVNS